VARDHQIDSLLEEDLTLTTMDVILERDTEDEEEEVTPKKRHRLVDRVAELPSIRSVLLEKAVKSDELHLPVKDMLMEEALCTVKPLVPYI
jgi:hypothetical protein